MKVTIYTVPECQFSKAEKEYLQAHNLSFEEKNLESNKDFMTEMLTVSDNFAGTPVTKIEKDDGTTAILKGYTKEDFDKALGITAEKETVVNSAINVPPKDTKPPETVTPQPTPPLPVVSPPAPTPPTVNDQPPATTQPPTQSSDALNSVLDNLQTKSTEPVTPPPAAPTNPPSTPTGGTPTIPDFNDK